MNLQKVAFHTLGCKVNAYETEAMTRMFEEQGYMVVPFHEQADIYVVNTCTVTNMADRKSRQMLHRARKMNPQALIVAVGCYVQADWQRVQEDEAIDVVIGNNQKSQVVSIVQQAAIEKRAVIDINHTNEYEAMEIDTTTEHTRAYVKVQDGCNQFCSYCLIPYVRGRIRSRSLSDAVEEVTRLAKNGYKEIVLTGIHLSSYGVDLDKKGEEINLLVLIQRLHQIDGIERIRLGSLEPRIITEEFVKALAALPKLCGHFHLSLQSGCDSVLKRMNRHYTTEEYQEKCRILRKYLHNPAITTDVIVGFPGETEEEFASTCAFLQEIRLAEAHIFKYSRRKGTVADRMPGQVQEKIKTQRSNQVIRLTDQTTADYRQSWVGKEAQVLFEEQLQIEGKTCWVGHTKEYLKVFLEDDRDLENTILTVILGQPNKEHLLSCTPVSEQ